MTKDPEDESKEVGVITSLVVICAEVVGLGVAAWMTGSPSERRLRSTSLTN